MSGDMLVVTTGARCRGSTGMSAEIRDVAKHPTMDRTAPHNKEPSTKYLVQNVNSANFEKLILYMWLERVRSKCEVESQIFFLLLLFQ